MPWFSKPAPPSDFTPPPRIAIEIDGDDVRAIEHVIRHAQRRRRGWRPDLSSLDRTGQELIAALYQRIGASVAAGNDKTVPLFQGEIWEIQQAQDHIRCYAIGHDPVEDKAQELLNKLHAKLGYAKATTERGGVSVIVPQIPAAEVGR